MKHIYAFYVGQVMSDKIFTKIENFVTVKTVKKDLPLLTVFLLINVKIKNCDEFISDNEYIENDYNKIEKINLLLSTIEKERTAGRISYYQAKEQ